MVGRVLRKGLVVENHVDVCRSAAVQFMWCSRAWGKRELAQWLLGPYTQAAGKLQATAIEPSTLPPPASGVFKASAPVLSAPTVVTDVAVQRLLRRSRKHLVAFLRTASLWKLEPGFSRRMLETGLIVSLIDTEGGLGYAPVASDRMHLVDRVRSLFIADYLTRPDDWGRFRVCDHCEGITFDLHNEHGTTCGASVAA